MILASASAGGNALATNSSMLTSVLDCTLLSCSIVAAFGVRRGEKRRRKGEAEEGMEVEWNEKEEAEVEVDVGEECEVAVEVREEVEVDVEVQVEVEGEWR